MKSLTNIALLSTLIALTLLATLTEGLDGTYQIRHPHNDLTQNDDEERQLSPLTTTLTNFWERAQCRMKLRACRRATKGQRPLPLDAWEVRASTLNGGNNSNNVKLVQTLQDAISKARNVDMAAITKALKTPTADAADKDALLEEARTIKAEAQAILKTSPALTVEGVPALVEKTQSVLNATSVLVEKVYGQQWDCVLLNIILAVPVAIILLWAVIVTTVCCAELLTFHDCNTVCFFLTTATMPILMPFMILILVVTLIVTLIQSILPVQRWSASSGATCFDDLLSCQYDRLLLSIIPTSIDEVEELG